MRIFDTGFEGRDTDFPQFDSYSGATIETSAPLRGLGSARFNCASAQYLHKDMPYEMTQGWVGLHFLYETPTGGNGLFQWRMGGSGRGDIRTGAHGRFELRVNGSLIATGSKILNAGQIYHFQMFLSPNGSYQYYQVKIDDYPIFDINYFLNSAAPTPDFDALRFGSIFAGGSGYLIIDDILFNDPVSVTGFNYTWPRVVAFVGGEPVDEGTGITNEWSVFPAATNPEDDVDDVPNDGETTFIDTSDHQERQTFTFDPITPIPGAILQAVKFESIEKVLSLTEGTIARVKKRFRSSTMTPQDEIQTITITGSPTGGTWNMTYDGISASAIAFDADLATVQARCDILFGAGNTDVTGTPGVNYAIAFQGQFDQTRMLLIEVGHSFTGGTDPDISIARTLDGGGIYEQGTPFQWSPPEDFFDGLGDAYAEDLDSTFRLKSARRETNPDNDLNWTVPAADQFELCLRSDFS